MIAMPAASWEAWQRAGALALVAGSLGVLLLRCASPVVPFLRPDAQAPWIMAPTPVSASLEQWGREDPPVTRFTRRLVLEAAAPGAELWVRALGSFAVSVNGEATPGGAAPAELARSVHRARVGVLLHPGENELSVVVANRHGPALLSLRSSGLEPPLRSDDGWQVAIDGRALGAAIPADDTRPNPAARAVETPLEGLARRWPALLALAGLGALALALGRGASARVRGALPGVALAAVTLGWAWLFVAKVRHIPLLVGFDARHHLAYLDYVREHHAVPLATEGWSMFHPPLFYVLAALAAPLGDAALRVLPWIAGLCCVYVAHALAQRLYRDDPRVAFVAVLLAGVLPVNLYSAAYFTNETLHALLASLALLACTEALLAERVSLRAAGGVGAWLGLAALTKFTALALAPAALFFLAVKVLAVERAPLSRALGRVALSAVVGIAIAGAYYARNVLHFGTPVLGNWGAMPGTDTAWWQQPGFHTLAYYTGFGEALRHPYLAGFHSFWDGIYSTFWGDGGIAGRVFPADRHDFWDYDFMSAGYALAAGATLVLVGGLGGALREALRSPDPHRRAALSFLLTAIYAIVFSLLSLTTALPYFAQAKASYALCTIAPLAVFFAAAVARIDDALHAPARAPLRLVAAGALAATLGCLWLGFAG